MKPNKITSLLLPLGKAFMHPMQYVIRSVVIRCPSLLFITYAYIFKNSISQIRNARELVHLRRICERQNHKAQCATDAKHLDFGVIISQTWYPLKFFRFFHSSSYRHFRNIRIHTFYFFSSHFSIGLHPKIICLSATAAAYTKTTAIFSDRTGC